MLYEGNTTEGIQSVPKNKPLLTITYIQMVVIWDIL